MYYWIYNGEIAGDSDSDAIQPPPGWSIAEGPDGGRDSLYYDGTAVLLKPERPTETALWDASTNSWLEPPAPPEPVPSPNWAALGDALVADIPILNKLAANPLFPALVGRLQTLRQGAAMGEPEPLIALWNNHSYSFTAAERKRFNDLATANLIPLRVSTDGSLGPLA
jgi:hypothetical protein